MPKITQNLVQLGQAATSPDRRNEERLFRIPNRQLLLQLPVFQHYSEDGAKIGEESSLAFQYIEFIRQSPYIIVVPSLATGEVGYLTCSLADIIPTSWANKVECRSLYGVCGYYLAPDFRYDDTLTLALYDVDNEYNVSGSDFAIQCADVFVGQQRVAYVMSQTYAPPVGVFRYGTSCASSRAGTAEKVFGIVKHDILFYGVVD
jgi:hypothetical protein